MKITTWRPDTCECVLAYGWEEHDPNTLTPVEQPECRRCAVHAALVTAVEHYAWVADENRTKNRSVNVVAEALGLTPLDIDWHFDERRELRLVLPSGISPSRLDTVQYHLTMTLGAEKARAITLLVR